MLYQLPLVRLSVALFVVIAATACGGDPSGETAGDGLPEGEPLAAMLPGIGGHAHPITTASPIAQRFFNQGLVMHYAFNNAEARRAFQEAQRLDPGCAMCFWGEALTLGPGVNGGMLDDNVPAAWEALQRAVGLAPATSEAEQGFIAALATRYAAEPVADRSPLDLAYVDAMAAVVAAYPEDSDAATLWAEAKMVSSPWDYWTEEGEPKEGFGDVLGILAETLELDPLNPGANHYYIHATEAVRPELALGAAERLENLVPIAGHLVHMPAHIYLRLGRYNDATVANERAMEADARYAEATTAQGVYPTLYMPHNPHFLCYTAAMEGRGEYTLEVAQAIAARIEEDGGPDPAIGTIQHYWITPLYVMARFGHWDEVLAFAEPDAALIYPRGVRHYARGLALLRRGDVAAAEAELAALEEIAAIESLVDTTVWDLNTADALMAIAREVLGAEIAAASGDYGAAEAGLRRAIETESTLTYDEPPPWYQPVRQVLGAILLEARRPAEAEAVYREDLEQYPDNGWSLFGLAQALEAQGRDATEIRARFDAAWSRADVTIAASRF